MTETAITRPDAKLWSAQVAGRVITPGDATAFTVPSGQVVTLQEMILDMPSAETAIYRFRYIAPAISRSSGTLDFEASIADMQHLCDAYAMPNIASRSPEKVQVIISFADMPVPFGETNPEVTQFIVAFSVKDGHCMLEPF